MSGMFGLGRRGRQELAGAPVPGRLSVVVPTRNSARALEGCLRSVREQTHRDVELIVVDNGSTDDTIVIAEAYADRVVQRGPERSAQRNHGWQISTGELVLFLDSDQCLEPGVAADAIEAFDADARLGALVIPEMAFGEGILARSRALEKRIYLGDPAVEAARIFRRSALEACGGYDERLTGPEDWELPDRLAADGWRIGRTRALVWHDEGRVRLRGAFGKKRYYAAGVHRYLKESSVRRPLVRARSLRRLWLLFRSPVAGAGLVALRTLEVAGMTYGLAEAARSERAAIPRASARTPYDHDGDGAAEPAPHASAPLAPRRRGRDALVAYLLPVLVAVLASLSWAEPGSFIAAGDVAPFVRDNLASELWSSWNHQLTGAGSMSYEIARAPDVLFLTVGGLLGLPGWVAQHALLALCFAFAGFGAAYLAGGIVRRPAAVAVAGVAGAFNPFAMVTLPNPLPLIAGGLLGVLVGMLWRQAQGRRISGLAVGAVTVVASYLAVNPPLLAVLAAAVAGAAATAGLVTRAPGGARRALALLGRAAPWALLLNLWWLVPVVQTTFGDHAGVLMTAQTDVSSWSWSHVRASLANVATLNAHWGWTHHEYFPYASAMESGPWPALRWLLPTGAAVGAIVARRRHRRTAGLLAALAVVLIFVGKGLHAPLAGVNAFLYDHVPGLWLLRDPMSKVGLIVVLVYAVLLALGLDRALSAQRPRARRTARVVTALVAAGVVAAVWPLVTGAVFSDDRKPLPGVHVEVPQAWHAAADRVNRSPVRGKALMLPLNTYYQVTTSWGYHGVDQIPQQLLRRPVIQRLPGGYYGETPGFDALLSRTEEALASGDERAAANLLRTLGVSHVLVRSDVAPGSQSTAYASADDLRRGLASLDAARVLSTSSTVEVFEVPSAASAIRAAGTLVGVDGPDETSRAAAIAAVPDGAVATPIGAAPLDALRVRMPAGRSEIAFRMARGGEHRVRGSERAALYQLTVDDGGRRLRFTDATSVRLDGRPLPARPPLEIALSRRPTALSTGGRLRPVEDGAVVALGAGPVVAYTLADPRPLRDFSPLEDCNRADDRSASEVGLALTRTGAGAVRLAARDHAACTWLTLDSGAPARAYELRLRHRHVAGAAPRICVWEEGPDRCAHVDPLQSNGGGWRTYRTTFTPGEETTGLRLYLYADGGAAEPTTVEYGDLTIAPLLGSGQATAPAPEPVIRSLGAGTHRLETFNPVPAVTGTGLSALEDCGASDDRTPQQAGLALKRRRGGVVDLRARAHIACAWIGLPDLGSADLVRVAFEYRSVSGRPARACLWEVGPDRCAELPALAPGTTWRRFETVVRPDSSTTGLRLFLYADGQESPPTRVEYRGFVLQPVAPAEIAIDAVTDGGPAADGTAAAADDATAVGSAASTPRLEWTQKRPDRYTVAVRGSRGAFTLVLAESAARGWSLDGLPEGWTATGLKADGYAMGWRITGTGDAHLTLSYAPAALGRAAIGISCLAALAAAVLLGGRIRRRRVRRSS
jgi:arabinofuranan 3-O-arabinosyltransferase